jgi:outer membrane immunogenic protein
MKRILLATVALASLAAPAMAADLRVKHRPLPPPPPPIFTWTGCYIGGNIGGVWVEKEITGPLGGSISGEGSSGAAGVQGGCNYQFAGGWVIGIQADYDWIDAGVERNSILFNATTSLEAKSVASLTGRIGYGWDRFLGYVRFGGAWERDELTFSFFNGFVATASDTRSGWTIGIGGEYAFSNWITGFVEYNYYDFGTRSHNFLCGPAACLLPIDVEETKSVFRVGLNFLFSAGKGPVAARY